MDLYQAKAYSAENHLRVLAIEVESIHANLYFNLPSAGASGLVSSVVPPAPL